MAERQDDGPADLVEGTVTSYDTGKGWGFIALAGSEKDVFVHHEEIEGECTRALVVGDRVRFRLVKGPKGPRAATVKKLAKNGDLPAKSEP